MSMIFQPRSWAPVVLLGGLLSLACPCATQAAEPPFSKEDLAFFEKQVLPILQNNCFKCHAGPGPVKSKLRLSNRESILKGGELGKVISLEKPESSRLLDAINYRGPKMPPPGKLSPQEIDVLTRWVKAGVPYSPGLEEVVKDVEHEEGKVTEEDRKYWAYKPLQRPTVPQVKDSAWVRSPIDAFLLQKLEEKHLAPAAPAERLALLRRVHYDLTGLPPTPAEVDAFLRDQSVDAYERVVDRLLASPQYGEKWGRHWLDLVRYAETHGYERDSAKPFAWRYRDYVINAFNKDKPYDEFLREQLAGDELGSVTTESMIATGYYRLGIWDDEPADRLLAKYDILDGIVSTTGQVFLGTTLGCVRCHGHKRDPIPHRDYYRFLAFFRDITDMNKDNLRKISTPADRQAQEKQARERQAREGELYQQIYELEQQFAVELAEKKGLKSALLPQSDMVDLNYRFYRDTWEKLPDFDALKHETTGKIANNFFTLAPASRQEAIGLVFEGKLKVPQQGEYTFLVEATEGVRLLVNGHSVLDRPNRGRQTGEAKATLEAGLLPIRLEFFNTYSKPELKVVWSGPGVEKRLLSTEPDTGAGRSLVADSRTEGQTWSYTVTAPAAEWTQASFKEEGWLKGTGGFGTRGTPGSKVRTDWNTPNIWLRKTFALEAVPAALALNLHHDEDVEVYLNGVQVYQAKGFLTEYQRIALGAEAVKALRKGTNVVAVHCLQTGGGQYIDLGLVEARATASLADLIRKHGAEVLDPRRLERYQTLTAQLEEVRKVPPALPGVDVMCVEERGRAETTILLRGNPAGIGEKVTAGFPEVLVSKIVEVPQRAPDAPSSGKRRALADWLTSRENPLTARVMANRLWQYHFGRGIVPTSNDFGKLGEPPTHPELLDWLADELRQGDWQIKRMQRLILLSNAYRMSSKASPEALRVDPGNALLWRFNMRRLTAEEVRDSILAVSGRLNLKAGGPSIYPVIPKEVLAGQSRPGDGWGKSTPEEAARRSVYVHVKRSLLVPILSTHDQADTDSSCAVRYTTTVPTQALGMLNGDFTNEQAVAFAERLQREAPGDLPAQVRLALRLTTARDPGAEEVQRDVKFVQGLQQKAKLDEQTALKQYCLLMVNANEFLYLD